MIAEIAFLEKKAGLGFELGELGYKSEPPIRPSLVA